MKLSHWDFRPARRSKYVAVGSFGRSSPPWKRPVFRILLLGAFGILVYLKFDAFVHSQALQSLKHPEKIWQAVLHRLHLHPDGGAPAVAAAAAFRDSTTLKLECPSPAAESCLHSWKFLGGENTGLIRALLLKSRADVAANPDRFAAALGKEEPALDGAGQPDSLLWSLSRLEIESGGRTWTWEPRQDKDGRTVYCAGVRCLEENPPQAPFRKFTVVDHGESRELWLRPLENPAVLCMLPGRIMDVTEEGGGLRSVKLYHGANIFSRYGGLRAVRGGLATGSRVNAGDTLGFAAVGDSSDPLKLRVEKDGVAEDAATFLGLQDRLSAAAETEAAHGR